MRKIPFPWGYWYSWYCKVLAGNRDQEFGPLWSRCPVSFGQLMGDLPASRQRTSNTEHMAAQMKFWGRPIPWFELGTGRHPIGEEVITLQLFSIRLAERGGVKIPSSIWSTCPVSQLNSQELEPQHLVKAHPSARFRFRSTVYTNVYKHLGRIQGPWATQTLGRPIAARRVNEVMRYEKNTSCCCQLAWGPWMKFDILHIPTYLW